MYKAFKEGQKRILVATDLVGRGIDIERVNIVINYDMPETDERHGNGADTYLHRVSSCSTTMHYGCQCLLSSPTVFRGCTGRIAKLGHAFIAVPAGHSSAR